MPAPNVKAITTRPDTRKTGKARMAFTAQFGRGGGGGPIDSPLKVKDGPDWKPAGLRVP